MSDKSLCWLCWLATDIGETSWLVENFPKSSSVRSVVTPRPASLVAALLLPNFAY